MNCETNDNDFAAAIDSLQNVAHERTPNVHQMAYHIIKLTAIKILITVQCRNHWFYKKYCFAAIYAFIYIKITFQAGNLCKTFTHTKASIYDSNERVRIVNVEISAIKLQLEYTIDKSLIEICTKYCVASYTLVCLTICSCVFSIRGQK